MLKQVEVNSIILVTQGCLLVFLFPLFLKERTTICKIKLSLLVTLKVCDLKLTGQQTAINLNRKSILENTAF